MRVLALALVLLTVPVGHAWATAQTPEVLVLNGRVLDMHATPLAPLLEDREDLEQVFEAMSSACWRGYVGTWHVEGGRLYLVSLTRQVYEPEFEDDEDEGVYVTKEVPLSTLFASDASPVEATWYTGTIRLPTGPERDYVHMGFATTYDRELHLEIARGRVVARREVDMRVEGRGRSQQDRTWVGIASATHAAPPVRDDGDWVDARSIESAAFQKAVPAGTPFVTRCVLDREGDGGPVVLWIPETLVTDELTIPVASGPAWPAKDNPWPHVELEATWAESGGEVVLHARWYRPLVPGETIHHAAYPLPDLPPEAAPDADAELDPDDWVQARSREDVEQVFGCEPAVTLRGKLVAGDPSQVHGVDVASDPELVGKAIVAVGVLEKWIITKRLLEIGHPDVRAFQSRGPGTYHRLVNPYTGRLARPRADTE